MQNLIERIRDEILPLFERYVAGENVHFENPYAETSVCCLAPDTEPLRDGSSSDAPAGRRAAPDRRRCWQVIGECRRLPHPSQTCLPTDCRECGVRRDACPTIVEELGEAFNHMVYLISRKEGEVRDAMNFTRNLASSLEDLDLENRQIREQLHRDPLTGLYNRLFLDVCLSREIERSRNRRRDLTVLMLDLDFFKSWNDVHGHLEGDRVLVRFSKLLRDSIREFDMAFRFGGDEFVILFPDTGRDEAVMVAERIRQRFGQLVFNVPASAAFPDGIDSRMISGGVATFAEGMSARDMLEAADRALYVAKSSGRNRIETSEHLVTA